MKTLKISFRINVLKEINRKRLQNYANIVTKPMQLQTVYEYFCIHEYSKLELCGVSSGHCVSNEAINYAAKLTNHQYIHYCSLVNLTGILSYYNAA